MLQQQHLAQSAQNCNVHEKHTLKEMMYIHNLIRNVDGQINCTNINCLIKIELFEVYQCDELTMTQAMVLQETTAAAASWLSMPSLASS